MCVGVINVSIGYWKEKKKNERKINRKIVFLSLSLFLIKQCFSLKMFPNRMTWMTSTECGWKLSWGIMPKNSISFSPTLQSSEGYRPFWREVGSRGIFLLFFWPFQYHNSIWFHMEPIYFTPSVNAHPENVEINKFSVVYIFDALSLYTYWLSQYSFDSIT